MYLETLFNVIYIFEVLFFYIHPHIDVHFIINELFVGFWKGMHCCVDSRLALGL